MTDRPPQLHELEQLFQQGRLSRRQLLAGLTALGFSAGGLELLLGSDPVPAEAQVRVAKYLVIIVLDAFRADYLSLQPMSSLASLARTGISYDHAWVGQLESETPVGHATLATGSMPRTQGLIGFEWRDPVTGLERMDGWAPGTIAGEVERDLRESGVPSIPLAVKAADPHARIVALSSEKVYAADAMGGWAADYILYHQRTKTGDLIPSAVPGHIPPQDFFSHPRLKTRFPLHHFTDWDYLSAVLALAAIQEFRPQVLMVNLPGADVYGHPYGGPATPNVLKRVISGLDRNVQRILDAYKQAGIYDQTLFVVTSDHGMVPNDRSVSAASIQTAVKEAGAGYMFHTGGTCADIYLHDYWHAQATSGTVVSLPNVAAAYYQVNRQGQYEYLPAPGMQINPSLDAAYQYLLGTFAGPTAPAVVAPYRENTIGNIYSAAHGDHGGLNWGAQHIPLIISGPGAPVNVVSHRPARLMDVAPTVLRLMGLPAQKMDGIVLADAVAGRTAQEAASQSRLSPTLTGYQNALTQQSVENIAEDTKTGHRPPPSAPERP